MCGGSKGGGTTTVTQTAAPKPEYTYDNGAIRQQQAAANGMASQQTTNASFGSELGG